MPSTSPTASASFAERFSEQLTSFVAGEFVSASGSVVPVIDPATGQAWIEVMIDPELVDRAVAAAAEAHRAGVWRGDVNTRANTLRRVAALVEQNADLLAEFETRATGKPIAATKVEIRYATAWYRYYASAIEVERDELVALSQTKTAQILQEAVGVVGAITPFNGGFSLGSWKFAPALAAGNTVVVKPPVVSSASTLLLASIMREAGLPDGVFNVVLGDAEVGDRLVSDSRVGVVSFTGSTAIGQQIGSKVAGRMAKFVCEAGGKSAHIVLDDADLTGAVIAAAQGVFSGSGQTCVAGSRLLVHGAVYDDFVERFVAHSAQITVGDPHGDVHLGPIATEQQYRRVVHLIDEAVGEGATVLLDGREVEPIGGRPEGFWVGPTILTDLATDATICRTEVFGPVVVIQRVSSLEEAISLANDSEFGLAAGIWTSSQARAHVASRQLQAGTVWVNTYRGMDWRTPFGGFKKSGIGRENGLESLSEFREVKTVVTDVGPAVDPFGIA